MVVRRHDRLRPESPKFNADTSPFPASLGHTPFGFSEASARFTVLGCELDPNCDLALGGINPDVDVFHPEGKVKVVGQGHEASRMSAWSRTRRLNSLRFAYRANCGAVRFPILLSGGDDMSLGEAGVTEFNHRCDVSLVWWAAWMTG